MPGQQHETILRFLAEPTDVNFGGKVHGGLVMKWIDQAGYAAAVGWSGRYCVTAAVGGIRFIAPVHIGELVLVRCRLILTGTSSMHFAVDVLARDLRSGAERLATHCVIVFVALDDAGRPVPVPVWQPGDAQDRELADYARSVMDLSRRVQQEAERHLPVAGGEAGEASSAGVPRKTADGS